MAWHHRGCLGGRISGHASPASAARGDRADHWVSKYPLSGVRLHTITDAVTVVASDAAPAPERARNEARYFLTRSQRRMNAASTSYERAGQTAGVTSRSRERVESAQVPEVTPESAPAAREQLQSSSMALREPCHQEAPGLSPARRMPRPAPASVNAASLSIRPRTKPPSAPITPNPPPSPRVPPAPADSTVNTEGPSPGLIRKTAKFLSAIARQDPARRCWQNPARRCRQDPA